MNNVFVLQCPKPTHQRQAEMKSIFLHYTIFTIYYFRLSSIKQIVFKETLSHFKHSSLACFVIQTVNTKQNDTKKVKTKC